MKKYTAAIFDLDGTLIDSTWVWVKIYDEFSDKLKIEKKFVYEQTVHMPPTECCEKLKSIYGLKQTVEELKQIFFESALNFYSKNVDLKPGVLNFFDKLKYDGIKIGLATSNFVEISEYILKKVNLIDYFDGFSYSDQLNVNKTTAKIYLDCAKKLEVAPNLCAIFEDITEPLNEVKKNDMGFFGIDDVSQSFEVKNRLKNESDYFIKSYEDFLNNEYVKFFQKV